MEAADLPRPLSIGLVEAVPRAPAAVAKARQDARAFEKNASRVSTDVYAHTAPWE